MNVQIGLSTGFIDPHFSGIERQWSVQIHHQTGPARLKLTETHIIDAVGFRELQLGRLAPIHFAKVGNQTAGFI